MASDNSVGGWEDAARNLARAIADAASAEVEESRLNDSVMQLNVLPPERRAATISLIVSPYEVILMAGHGTRFELDALPASADEVIGLALAITGGGPIERIRGNRVDFELRLEDGTRHVGRVSRWGLPVRSGSNGEEEIEYPPYTR